MLEEDLARLVHPTGFGKPARKVRRRAVADITVR
jgi:hypothetical protein